MQGKAISALAAVLYVAGCAADNGTSGTQKATVSPPALAGSGGTHVAGTGGAQVPSIAGSGGSGVTAHGTGGIAAPPPVMMNVAPSKGARAGFASTSDWTTGARSMSSS